MHLRFWRKRPACERVHVLLNFEDGGSTMLGPMDRFVAEVFLVNELAHHPFHFKRRVTSSRIVVE